MKVIEQFTLGKLGKESLNEDGLFVSNDFIAIIDGASSFKNEKVTVSDTKSTGRIARDSIMETMESLTEKDYNLSKLMVEKKITKGLYDCLPLDNQEFFRDNMEYGLEASVVIYSRHYQELWVFGDINIFVNEKSLSLDMSQVHKDIINERVNLVKERLKTENYRDVYDTDTSFNDIKESIHKQRNLANKENGYLVFTGFPINWHLSKTICLTNNDTVILTTDGYVNVGESLAETEKFLKEDLIKDPLCIKELIGMKPYFKENMSFDDRTFIKFKA